MAKNITIAEDGSAKNFTDVKRLQTSLIGGGSQNWIPEDEAVDYTTLKSKTVKENGTFYAEDDNADGYSSVTVELETEMISKVIKANGEYHASDDKAGGYDIVTVNVQSGVDFGGAEVKATAASNLKMGDTVVVTNESDDGLTYLNSTYYSAYEGQNKYMTHKRTFLTETGLVYGNSANVTDAYSGLIKKILPDFFKACVSPDQSIYAYAKQNSNNTFYKLGVVFKTGREIEIVLDYEAIEGTSLDVPALTFYNDFICAVYKVNGIDNSNYMYATIYDIDGNRLNGKVLVGVSRYTVSRERERNVMAVAVSKDEIIGLFENSEYRANTGMFRMNMMESSADITYINSFTNSTGLFNAEYGGRIADKFIFTKNEVIYITDITYPPASFKQMSTGRTVLLSIDPYYNQMLWARFLSREDTETVQWRQGVMDVSASEIYHDIFGNIWESLYSNNNKIFIQNSDLLVWQATYLKDTDKATMRKSAEYPKDGSSAKLGIVKNDVSAGNVGTAVVLFT